MALDISDHVINNDILVCHTDKYRSYNLLENDAYFPINYDIGLHIAQMMQLGLDMERIESIVVEYLQFFNIRFERLNMMQQAGTVIFDFGDKSDV